MAKKFDPKAKAKRQKIIIAVGGVLLLGLLAFQIPRTMKMLHQEDPPDEPAAVSTTPGSNPLAPPTLSGDGASLAATSSGSGDGLVDPDTPPAPASGQLVSFSLFKSKDPFHQQVKDCGTGACDVAVPATTAKPKSTPAPATSGTAASSSGSVVPSLGGTTSSPKPAPASAQPVRRATISVNGVSEVVEVGKSFPTDDPVFKLVSLTRKKATISIAGGSFESGAQSITLELGKTLVLLNTADGTRYELNLLSTRP
jgi:hypothetical protein